MSLRLARRGSLAVGRGSALPAGIGAHATKSANSGYSTDTWTSIALNTETFDTDGFHDNASNNTRFTVPAGEEGYYLVGGAWRGSGSFERTRNIIGVWKNGAAIVPGSRYEAGVSVGAGGTGPSLLSGSLVYLAAGDYVEVRFYTSNSFSPTDAASTIGAYVLKVGT